MAVDTKQKRGSLIGYGMPWRRWKSEPAGEFGVGGRLSLLGYFAGEAGAPADIPNLICIHNITAHKPSVTITASKPTVTIARTEC
jgi:hypothetical protein